MKDFARISDVSSSAYGEDRTKIDVTYESYEETIENCIRSAVEQALS